MHIQVVRESVRRATLAMRNPVSGLGETSRAPPLPPRKRLRECSLLFFVVVVSLSPLVFTFRQERTVVQQGGFRARCCINALSRTWSIFRTHSLSFLRFFFIHLFQMFYRIYKTQKIFFFHVFLVISEYSI